jgi:hypothetical protein
MKIQMYRQLWIILFVVILISFTACEPKVKSGTIKNIEFESTQIENDPPYKPGGNVFNRYSSWDEAYAAGWKDDGIFKQNKYRTLSKPTGFAIVLLEDGTNIRCKNPFPDLTVGQKVKVKETATGDWVITQ